MCVAFPMEVVEIDGVRGKARSGGLEVEIGLELVEDVALGDYVIVHAGYAIQRLSPEEARETLAVLERLAEYQATFDDDDRRGGER